MQPVIFYLKSTPTYNQKKKKKKTATQSVGTRYMQNLQIYVYYFGIMPQKYFIHSSDKVTDPAIPTRRSHSIMSSVTHSFLLTPNSWETVITCALWYSTVYLYHNKHPNPCGCEKRNPTSSLTGIQVKMHTGNQQSKEATVLSNHNWKQFLHCNTLHFNMCTFQYNLSINLGFTIYRILH